MHFFSAGDREYYHVGRFLKICELAAPWYETVEDPEAMVDALKGCSHNLHLFTFFQRVPHVEPRFRYHVEPYSVSVIKLTNYHDWFHRALVKNSRQQIKKAQKIGVDVRVVSFDDRLVEGICRINNETPIRQGKRFPHYMDPSDKVRRENGTFLDRSVFLGAYFENEFIGYAKIVFEKEFADLLQLLSMVSHRDKNPNNALIAEAVKLCCERRAGYLAYGDWNDTGLGQFKRHNGFSRMDLPRYYIPLNWMGALALRMGLHRRASDMIPAQIVPLLKALRTRWHETKVKRGGRLSPRGSSNKV